MRFKLKEAVYHIVFTQRDSCDLKLMDWNNLYRRLIHFSRPWCHGIVIKLYISSYQAINIEIGMEYQISRLIWF